MTIQELTHRILKSYIRNFPIAKGKDIVLALLWQSTSSGHYKRQTQLRQANIQMNCDLTKFIQRRLYFYGSYEEEQCQGWMKLASRAEVIFDIGANVGVYSLLAATTNPQADIHAFEPTPEMVNALTANIRLNDIQNIKINPVGAGKVSGKGFLHLCTGSDGSNEGMNFVTSEFTQSSDVPIGLISIDDYCRQLKIGHIDLMKMDIEGGEYEALLGAQSLLQTQAISYIFIEFAEWAAHRSGHSTADIRQLLVDAGYSLHQFKNGKLLELPMDITHSSANVVAVANTAYPKKSLSF